MVEFFLIGIGAPCGIHEFIVQLLNSFARVNLVNCRGGGRTSPTLCAAPLLMHEGVARDVFAEEPCGTYLPKMAAVAA
jgi:hypothetical protein